jgi:hypothetical protein
MTQTYLNGQPTTAPGASRVASAARAASFKRACVYRHNFTWTKSQLFVEVILILKWFGWINWREFLNPQSNPQHAVSCAIFNDLSGPWQSPRSCKSL